jgi:excisionase family DNA binding protein
MSKPLRPEDPLFTPSEAAKYLTLGKSTLDNKRHLGGGPAFLKLGKVVRYRKSDLDTWVASLVRRSTSDAGPAAA